MAKVSVIIPVYNRAHLLRESINSVLDQDYQDIEVVVVDDGSVEPIKDVVRQYDDRVRYIRQENSGASAARNMGVLHSTGDYLMFLDSDDILLPNALERLANALDGSREYGAAYCGFIERTEDGDVGYRSSLNRFSGNVFGSICTEYLCIVHSVMTRRRCLARTGLFDTTLTMYEDMEFYARLAAYYEFIFVPEWLVEYRLAYNQASKEKHRLAEQKGLYMRKMCAWRESGMLDKKQWRALERKIYGFRRGEARMHEAYKAYSSSQWHSARSSALWAALYDPRHLSSRSWWGLTIKSLYRSLKQTRNQADSNA